MSYAEYYLGVVAIGWMVLIVIRWGVEQGRARRWSAAEEAAYWAEEERKARETDAKTTPIRLPHPDSRPF